MPSTTTIAPARLPGKKSIENWYTCLGCVNAGGSEKKPLLIVGKSANPRCFRGATTTDLNLHYDSSAKGWMNKDIFKR